MTHVEIITERTVGRRLLGGARGKMERIGTPRDGGIIDTMKLLIVIVNERIDGEGQVVLECVSLWFREDSTLPKRGAGDTNLF